MNITKKEFGKVNGETVYLYSMENDKGMKVSITNFGGIMTSLFVPDKNGKAEDVILGFDNLADYQKEHPYFGAVIGRFGNRIARGSFQIDNKSYTLAINDGLNHLHGGIKGFDKVIWKAEEILEPDRTGLRLTYFSKDMEEGYPGNLSVEMIYYINNDNELGMEYVASTDKKTHINLTQHNYYNLNACKSDIKDHVLTLFARTYLEVDGGSIPTGGVLKVAGTPFDFQNPKRIGKGMELAGGFDHNFIMDDYDGSMKLIASVHEPDSGRVLEVLTTQPAVQFYTSNYLDGGLTGKYGINYKKHSAFCLETQHFPDSPNHPTFPSTMLEPGKKFHELTLYRFTVKD